MKPDFSYKITQKVKNFITENNMTGHGDSVIVGLSGGADSVCLFLLLNKLKDELGIDLHAVHVNHCIRGESAKEDELFSYELCNKYNIPFIAYEINVPEIAERDGLTLEEAGRNARYACFADYAGEIMGSKKIAVAQHMDDQAETVIFNMIRGSGLNGISGMDPVSDNGIIRPLLCLTKEEIIKYLEFIGQDYRTDETNSDNDYSRNQIRNVVMPALEKLQPKTGEHISMMADDVRAAKDFIDNYVEQVFSKTSAYIREQDNTDNASEKSASGDTDGSEPDTCEGMISGISLKVSTLKNENPFIAKELIILTLRQLISTYKDITKTHINDIYGLVFKGKGKMVNLPYGLTAIREKDFITIKKDK